eukprot:2252492-Rhodomonas_salina.1
MSVCGCTEWRQRNSWSVIFTSSRRLATRFPSPSFRKEIPLLAGRNSLLENGLPSSRYASPQLQPLAVCPAYVRCDLCDQVEEQNQALLQTVGASQAALEISSEAVDEYDVTLTQDHEQASHLVNSPILLNVGGACR